MDYIPPEKESGCIEYKWKLLNIGKYKTVKLSSQMLWRVHEGEQSALYVIGVHDNGKIIGITKQEFIETYITLLDCASKNNLHLCIKYMRKINLKSQDIKYWGVLQIFKSRIPRKTIKFDYDIPKVPKHLFPYFVNYKLVDSSMI
jgi:GTPase